MNRSQEKGTGQFLLKKPQAQRMAALSPLQTSSVIRGTFCYGGIAMFDIDTFIADCRSAVEEDPTHKSVTEIVRRALSNPSEVMAAFGEPKEPGITPLYQSPDLTVINLAWKPSTTIPPHNHEMWAVIGIYGGREDNIFWRRVKDHPDGLIEAAGARALSTGDVCPMGSDIIHSVTNPIPRLTAALHVYGGDFFEAERSEWEPECLVEHQLDIEEVRARFSN